MYGSNTIGRLYKTLVIDVIRYHTVFRCKPCWIHIVIQKPLNVLIILRSQYIISTDWLTE